MKEFISGIAILIVPMFIVSFFLLRWRKDYKKTGKIIILYDKNTKYWLIPCIILFIILGIAIFSDYSLPGINPDNWNPSGWYG